MLDELNTDITKSANKFNISIDINDTPKQILDKVVQQGYGRFYFDEITKVFNYANFVRMVFDAKNIDSQSIESLYNYTAGWANYAATAVESKAVDGKWFASSSNLNKFINDRMLSGISSLSAKAILASGTERMIQAMSAFGVPDQALGSDDAHQRAGHSMHMLSHLAVTSI